MINSMYYIFGFILAIGILVTVHEFGHFWVARRLGVKVLRFSIGFGPPIWQRVSPKDGVEYVIAAIPLGGYVKMLGEHDDKEVTEQNRHEALESKPVTSRMAIVLAGPMANFIFAIFALALLFMIGTPGIKPYVTATMPESHAAKAGFREGDLITRIDGKEVSTWARTMSILFEKVIDRRKVAVDVVDSGGRKKVRVLDFSSARADLEPHKLIPAIGLVSGFPGEIGRVVVNPALETTLGASRALHSTLFYQNGFMPFHPEALSLFLPDINPAFRVTAASQSGLMAGDRLRALYYTSQRLYLVNTLNAMSAHMGVEGSFQMMIVPMISQVGVRLDNWRPFQAAVAQMPSRPIALLLDRKDERRFVSIVPHLRVRGNRAEGFVGVAQADKYYEFALEKYGPFVSVGKGVSETLNMSYLMLKVFYKMVTLQISARHISGPLTIGKYAGQSVKSGWSTFLRFLAVISISLGVINLLPIPVLDGGHFMFYLVEAIKGSPVSEAARMRGHVIGLALLLALMTLAFYNDIVTFLGLR